MGPGSPQLGPCFSRLSLCVSLCRMEETGSGNPTYSSPLPQAGDGSQPLLDFRLVLLMEDYDGSGLPLSSERDELLARS